MEANLPGSADPIPIAHGFINEIEWWRERRRALDEGGEAAADPPDPRLPFSGSSHAFGLAPEADGLIVANDDIGPADGLALRDVAFENNAMGEADRQRAVAEAARRRPQLAPDGVSAFAVEGFTGLQIALGDGDRVAAESTASTPVGSPRSAAERTETPSSSPIRW